MNSNDEIFDDFRIIAAAKNQLDMVARTSFSSDGFSPAEKDAIANAIAAGIQAYEEQKNSNQ